MLGGPGSLAGGVVLGLCGLSILLTGPEPSYTSTSTAAAVPTAGFLSADTSTSRVSAVEAVEPAKGSGSYSHRGAVVALAERDDWWFEALLICIAFLPLVLRELFRRKPRPAPLRAVITRRNGFRGEDRGGARESTIGAIRR